MTLSSSRIEIVGLGQIGSSLASAIIKNNLAKEVIGFTRNLETAKVAQKMGIVTKVFMDEKEIFKQKADLVIFAVPVHALIPLIQKIPDNQN
ncbi:MAG: NAD(P)-binding domain-containing protein, partial [Candidatus Eremiobacteraeota bacterium]|nr:NAD(P)-binding domain-containing protein [Candidatus Eremiobacteraeota bacterium]